MTKHAKANRWAIRRIVDAMCIQSTEEQIRARVRECCAAGCTAEFIQACEDAAVKYFREIVPAGREA